MTQHDQNLANAAGATFRADANNALAALFSNSSGATEPTTTVAYQWWADTTTGLLKIRNAANSAWVTVGTLASTNLGLASLDGATFTGVTAHPDGSAAAPSIAHSGDLNCGIFFPAADTVAVATAGTERMRIDSSGNFGIGVAPAVKLDVYNSAAAGAYNEVLRLRYTTSSVAGDGAAINFTNSSGTSVGRIGSVIESGTLVGFKLGVYSSGIVDSVALPAAGGLHSITATGLLGYGTGAGGTVTQTTSKTTGVTLNKPTGVITMDAAALGAGVSVIFALSNSLLSSTDTINVSHNANGGTANAYTIQTLTVGAGSVVIRVTNITGGSLSEAVQISFTVTKGVSA